MKKHLSILISCLGVAALSGCANYLSDTTSTKIEGEVNYSLDFFKLNRYNVNLHANETHQISMLAIPEKYANEKIKFRSKDTSVAEVSDKGLVSAKAKGFTQIELYDDKDEVVEKINVAVSEDLKNEDVGGQCDHLVSNMTQSGFKFDTKISAHESASEQFFVDNKVTRETSYVEDIVISEDDAYFKVASQDISILTQGGGAEHSSGEWLFYVDEYWMGYLFHTTKTVKNYYEVDCSSYISKKAKPIDVIYDILDMFFVDGRTIATDILDNCRGINDIDRRDPDDLMKGFIPDCFENDYSNVPAKRAGVSGDDDLFASITLFNQGEVVTAEMEEDIDVESDTVFDETEILDSFYHNNRVEGTYIASQMDYKLNGKNAKRTFTKEYRFDRDFELEYPDFKAYKKVDQFYDL